LICKRRRLYSLNSRHRAVPIRRLISANGASLRRPCLDFLSAIVEGFGRRPLARTRLDERLRPMSESGDRFRAPVAREPTDFDRRRRDSQRANGGFPPIADILNRLSKSFQFLWGLRQCAACDGCFADFSDEPGVRRRPLLARRLFLIKYVIPCSPQEPKILG
jgi:hypothetical protein